MGKVGGLILIWPVAVGQVSKDKEAAGDNCLGLRIDSVFKL